MDDLREKLASSVKTGNTLSDLFDEIWDGDGQHEEIDTEIKKTEAEIRCIKAQTGEDGQEEHVEAEMAKTEAEVGGILHLTCHDEGENEKALETKIDKLNEESLLKKMFSFKERAERD